MNQDPEARNQVLNEKSRPIDHYVYINEVLKTYPTSGECFEAIHGDAEKHFGFYPHAIRIDRRIETVVEWVNETDSEKTLHHDVAGEQRIPAGGSFSYTFAVEEHPPGSLYYTVGDNQPGQTIGFPIT